MGAHMPCCLGRERLESDLEKLPNESHPKAATVPPKAVGARAMRVMCPPYGHLNTFKSACIRLLGVGITPADPAGHAAILCNRMQAELRALQAAVWASGLWRHTRRSHR